MKTFESAFTSGDGIKFFVRGWEPETKPKAVIALIHGLGEHTGRYEHVARAMTEAGYALVGFDLRGHGRSGGPRGHFPSLESVMQDIQKFLVFLTERYPNLPEFLYGHSLGGLLVLTSALKNQAGLKGVIATSSGLRSQVHEQKLKIVMARLLGSVLPTVQIANGLDLNVLTHDQKVIDVYKNDPLNHDRISLGFGKAGLEATDYAWGHAGQFSLPLLIMHGTADRNTYASGSEDFAKLAAKNNKDVTLKLWEGLYHETHNEPEQQEVLGFIIHWLDQHM